MKLFLVRHDGVVECQFCVGIRWKRGENQECFGFVWVMVVGDGGKMVARRWGI